MCCIVIWSVMLWCWHCVICNFFFCRYWSEKAKWIESIRETNSQYAIGTNGAGQPGAGLGGHHLAAHPARVPRLPGPHHPSHQTMCERAPGMHRLLSPPPTLSDLSVRNVRGEKPWDGTGFKTFEVSLPVPPYGLQGGLHPCTKGGTWEELSLPTAQMSFPWTVFIWRSSLCRCTSFKIRPLCHPRSCPTIWNTLLQSKTLFQAESLELYLQMGWQPFPIYGEARPFLHSWKTGKLQSSDRTHPVYWSGLNGIPICLHHIPFRRWSKKTGTKIPGHCFFNS